MLKSSPPPAIRTYVQYIRTWSVHLGRQKQQITSERAHKGPGKQSQTRVLASGQ